MRSLSRSAFLWNTDTASRSSRASPASSLTRWGGSGRCSSRGVSGRRRWRRGRWRSRRRWFPWRVRSRVEVAEGVWREGCVCACEREVCLVAFVCCCFACDCVLELVVCRVRFARVSCPRLRFGRQVKGNVNVKPLPRCRGRALRFDEGCSPSPMHDSRKHRRKAGRGAGIPRALRLSHSGKVCNFSWPCCRGRRGCDKICLRV